MRLLLLVVIVVLAFGTLGFMATNPDARVTVRVANTVYEQAHVGYLVIFSVLAGAVAIGIVAVGEGARIRLENRRLRRERDRLESELHFLRTQPPEPAPIEPDEPQQSAHAPAPETAAKESAQPAEAPVYEATDPKKRWPPDSSGGDEDTYSGGSAV